MLAGSSPCLGVAYSIFFPWDGHARCWIQGFAPWKQVLPLSHTSSLGMCPPMLHFYMCSRWCGVCADRKLSIKSFSPSLGDIYCRLIIVSGGCLEVVTTTQVPEESMWAKQLAFCFRLGNRSERSTEFLMGRQDSTSKANKHYCLFHLLIVCYGGQGPPPETVGHHSCYKWAGWHTYCGRLAS